MLTASLFYLLIKGMDIGLAADQILSNLYSSYVLIAVPLFVFTANVMNTGKITDYVFNFAHSVVGRMRGALGHVNVLASLIFSGMTGSAVADASGLGLIEIKAMREKGYDDGFSCAITAASSVIGPIFPPSIPMVLYAMLSGASVGKLFMGGMVPGILIAAILMIYIVFIAKKRNFSKGERITFKTFAVDTFKAIPALLTPIILLGGIYTGVMTPTEAGAVAALYSLLLSFFVYRAMGLKDLLTVLRDTVKMIGILLIMVGASYCFSFIVTLEHIPDMVARLTLGITTNKYVLLFIINVVFLILGMLMDTSAIILVFIPMVLPMVNQLGIDLVHFGVIIVLNMMIGLLTPPFGMLLFITSGISGTPLKTVIKNTLPMLGVMLVVLAFVTYIPEIILFFPELCFK
jgi:tripartite ATP-independent transporter DctM subunit